MGGMARRGYTAEQVIGFIREEEARKRRPR